MLLSIKPVLKPVAKLKRPSFPCFSKGEAIIIRWTEATDESLARIGLVVLFMMRCDADRDGPVELGVSPRLNCNNSLRRKNIAYLTSKFVKEKERE